MRDKGIKFINFICAMSLLISILVISMLIQADMNNDTNSENIIEIVNSEDIVDLASASDAEKTEIDNDKTESIAAKDSDNSESIATKDSDNSENQDKSLEDELATNSDALEMDGLFDFETFGGNIDYVHVSPNIYWEGDDLDTVYVGRGQEERNAAQESLSTKKSIDYVNHTITWSMTIINQGNTWWQNTPFTKTLPRNTEVYLYIPKHQGDIVITRRHSRAGSKVMDLKKGIGNNRQINRNGSLVMDPNNPPFSKWYNYFREAAGNAGTDEQIKRRGGIPGITSNINWFTDTGVISQIYRDNDTQGIGPGESITYTFTTRHSKEENLDNAVGGISIRHYDNSNDRYMLRGKFGVARRHNLRTPDFRYVKDKNNLTEAEKERLRKDVVNKTIEYYKRSDTAFGDEEVEELKAAYNDGNIDISNIGEVFVTWDDGTKSRLLNVEDYIGEDKNPPIISITPDKVSILSKNDPIEFNVSAKDEEGFLSELDTVDLPEGLRVVEKQLNNKTGSMKIVGNLTNIDSLGESKIKIRARDSWGNTSEKEVIIDTSMVPVGTNESGYKLPLLIIFVSFFAFSYAFINLRQKEEY